MIRNTLASFALITLTTSLGPEHALAQEAAAGQPSTPSPPTTTMPPKAKEESTEVDRKTCSKAVNELNTKQRKACIEFLKPPSDFVESRKAGPSNVRLGIALAAMETSASDDANLDPHPAVFPFVSIHWPRGSVTDVWCDAVERTGNRTYAQFVANDYAERTGETQWRNDLPGDCNYSLLTILGLYIGVAIPHSANREVAGGPTRKVSVPFSASIGATARFGPVSLLLGPVLTLAEVPATDEGASDDDTRLETGWGWMLGIGTSLGIGKDLLSP